MWRQARAGSAAARQTLFGLHRDLARRIARRHFRSRALSDVELADLDQLAFVGLLEAIDRYDPEQGVPFSAYARRRIAGAVLDGLAKMSEVGQQVSFRARLQRERVRSLAPADPMALASSEAMNSLIELAVELAVGFMLEAGVYIEPDAASNAQNAYESLAWSDSVRHLVREVEGLQEREKTVVTEHYFNGLAFEQIASLLQLSKGRIAQLHKSAITRLRKRLPNVTNFHLER